MTKGRTTLRAIGSACNAPRHLQPSDQFMPDWTFAGTAQEASIAYLIGRKLAEGTDWPMWNAGNEYAPLRASGPKWGDEGASGGGGLRPQTPIIMRPTDTP